VRNKKTPGLAIAYPSSGKAKPVVKITHLSPAEVPMNGPKPA